MSFTPFARYRNFTLANLKALLEVYPDMARSIPWEEAANYAQTECQFRYCGTAIPFLTVRSTAR